MHQSVQLGGLRAAEHDWWDVHTGEGRVSPLGHLDKQLQVWALHVSQARPHGESPVGGGLALSCLVLFTAAGTCSPCAPANKNNFVPENPRTPLLLLQFDHFQTKINAGTVFAFPHVWSYETIFQSGYFCQRSALLGVYSAFPSALVEWPMEG